ncbi:MAG: hypothetical protein V8Q42_09750 [Anaerovoracaceae bacterium]
MSFDVHTAHIFGFRKKESACIRYHSPVSWRSFFVYDDADPVHMPVETVEIAVCEKCIAELQQ